MDNLCEMDLASLKSLAGQCKIELPSNRYNYIYNLDTLNKEYSSKINPRRKTSDEMIFFENVIVSHVVSKLIQNYI
jgi:hypothetical protein